MIITNHSYSSLEDPNINFTILPSIDKETFPAFKPFLDHVKIEEFDVFLIFITDRFDRRYSIFLKEIKLHEKPFFLIQTKMDHHADKRQKQSDDDTMFQNMKSMLGDDFTSDEIKVFLISNHYPEERDFPKLIKEVVDVLPSDQQESLCQIPSIRKLIDLHEFQTFLKGVEEQESNVTAGYIQELRELFLKKGIVGVQRMMTDKLAEWRNVKINLAILGNSGAGKSSFINAIRGIEDEDELAAETGITETTLDQTSYKHQSNPNILFWDLPGIGTMNYPDLPIFCRKVGIEKYDTFLIVCHTRFTQYDLMLAEKVKSMGKSFFFVRTKVDQAMKSEKRKKKTAFDEEKVLKILKDDCVKNLASKAFEVAEERVFLISSYYPTQWDFERLEKAILDQLPVKQKEALMLSLHTKSKDILKEKLQLIKGRVYMVAAASIKKKKRKIWSSFQYICEKSVTEAITSYCSQLAFPKNASEEFKMLTKDLQKKVRKIYPNYDDFLQWLKRFDPEHKHKLKKRNKRYIVAKEPISFVNYCLKSILNEIEEIALHILDEAAKRAVADDE